MVGVRSGNNLARSFLASRQRAEVRIRNRRIRLLAMSRGANQVDGIFCAVVWDFGVGLMKIFAMVCICAC